MDKQGEAGDSNFRSDPLEEESVKCRYQVCPTCQGSGFLDLSRQLVKETEEPKKISKAVSTSALKGSGDPVVALPKIKCSLNQRSKYHPVSPKYKTPKSKKTTDTGLPPLSSKAISNNSSSSNSNNNSNKHSDVPTLPPIEGLKQSPKICKESSKPKDRDDLPVALPKIKCPLSLRSSFHPESSKNKILKKRSSDTNLPLLPAISSKSSNSNSIVENKRISGVSLPKIINKDEDKSDKRLPPIPNCRKRLSSPLSECVGEKDTITSKSSDNNVESFRRTKAKDMSYGLPPIHNRHRKVSSASSEGGGDVEYYDIKQIDNKAEFVKRTKVKMKSNNLADICAGVEDVVHLAKIDENAAFALMPQVNRNLCTMLRSLKVKVVRQACRIIAALFGRVSYVSRPEFDDIVALLLTKTADSKNSIRKDALTALDVIVAATPVQDAVRAIHSRGPKSKNPLVRITTAKMMNTLVKSVGYQTLLNNPTLLEMRKRVLETGCILLNDRNSDVRSIGRKLMSHFVALEDFEEALLLDVPQNTIKKVEKSINGLRLELLKTMDLLKVGDIKCE